MKTHTLNLSNAIDAAAALDKALWDAVSKQTHKLTAAQAQAVHALHARANALLLAVVDTEHAAADKWDAEHDGQPPAHLDKLQSSAARLKVSAILRKIHGPVIAAPANLSSVAR